MVTEQSEGRREWQLTVREPQDGEEALALGFHAGQVLSKKVEEKQQR